MAKRKINRRKKPNSHDEIVKLHSRLTGAREASEDDIQRLKALVLKSPEPWEYATSVSMAIRRDLINKIGDGAKAYLLAQVALVKKDTEYANAPPLERLLIDHLITTHVRLIYAETQYSAMQSRESYSYASGSYCEKLLSLAHRRFLQAVETLAKVRKLARNTPALQINIAQDGGQQVNMQKAGDGEKPTTA